MARFNDGWLKLWRGAWEKDLSTNVHLWAIWHVLLHLAHWKESSIIWNGQRRVIPAGSVVLGIKEIATRFHCSQRTVSKWLHYLHRTDRIVLETCARGTLVTIRNWETYQGDETKAFAVDSNFLRTDCAPGRIQVGLIEEDKKERSNSDVERKRSPVGPIAELSGNTLTEKALEDVPHKTQRTWLEAYPDMGWIRGEIPKAMAWLEVNPKRRPKSLARFLGGWLARGWERHRKSIPTSNGSINTKPLSVEDIA